MVKSHSSLLATVALLALAHPGTAFAQEQPTAEEPAGDIFVTARGRQESIQTVPMSITAQ